MLRIARAPSVKREIDAMDPPDVRLVRVTDTPGLREKVAEIYRRNPSPFVNGPKSVDQLDGQMGSGVRYYLVESGAGEVVGVRAFDTRSCTLQNTITDFNHRGRGYQLRAGKLLREQLASEGFNEFHSNVLRANTRIRRAMEAGGWEMTEDPDNPDLIRCVLRMGQQGDEQES